MSHVWMRHVTHMNESHHTYGWVMSHIWVSHVTRINASCHTYEWVTSHIWMSHVTRMSESCHTYKCVISHVWMSDAMYINTSHVTCGWVMSHIWIVDLFLWNSEIRYTHEQSTLFRNSLYLMIHMCTTTHCYIWIHRLIHMCNMTHFSQLTHSISPWNKWPTETGLFCHTHLHRWQKSRRGQRESYYKYE